VTPQTYVLHTVAEAASFKRIPYYPGKHHQVTYDILFETGKYVKDGFSQAQQQSTMKKATAIINKAFDKKQPCLTLTHQG